MQNVETPVFNLCRGDDPFFVEFGCVKKEADSSQPTQLRNARLPSYAGLSLRPNRRK